jgi:hypothetical protein
MTEKEAQGNPAQPAGWAVGEEVNPDTYPNGELLALEEQKRKDTATWEDAQNRSPMDNENPAQPAGFAVPAPSGGPIPGQGADAIRSAAAASCHCTDGQECSCKGGKCHCVDRKKSSVDVVAKVFVSKTAGREEGGKVLLGTSQDDYTLGEVVAVTDQKFWVEWRDGEDSIEKKADYQLIVRDDENDEE